MFLVTLKKVFEIMYLFNNQYRKVIFLNIISLQEHFKRLLSNKNIIFL